MYHFRNSVSFFHNSKMRSSPSLQAVIIEAATSKYLHCQHSAASRHQSPLIVYCLEKEPRYYIMANPLSLSWTRLYSVLIHASPASMHDCLFFGFFVVFAVNQLTTSFLSLGWPFGSLVCKMSGMIQGISVSASVFTLVAIAVDR